MTKGDIESPAVSSLFTVKTSLGPAFQECTGSYHENVPVPKTDSSDLQSTDSLTVLARKEVYSDSIQMTTMYFNILTIFGHFFANCMVIFQKTEVQAVILRCLMGLYLEF